MTIEVLISRLREDAEWADGNIWEVPITLPEDLKAAANELEQMTNPTTIEELGLSTRAYSSLYRWNLRLLRDVAKLTEAELLKIPGIGKGAAQEILEKVKEVYGR